MPKTDDRYDDMTLAELHDKAKEAGLTGTSHMKKDELIEALSSGKSHGDSTDSTDGRKRDDKGHFEKSDSHASETKHADAKSSETKSSETASAAKTATTKSNEADGAYEDMTLAELHEKAKEAGLTGTSHMKKDELVEALSAHGHGTDDKKSSKATTHDNADRPRDDKGHFESDGKKSESKETAKK